jgi:hypothetical protein
VVSVVAIGEAGAHEDSTDVDVVGDVGAVEFAYLDLEVSLEDLDGPSRPSSGRCLGKIRDPP